MKELNSNKIIASTSVWVFLFPLLAKLDFLSSAQMFGFLSEPSMHFLYFSALSFFVASTFYAMFCPYLLKKFNTFKEFHESGMSIVSLSDEVEKLTEKEAETLIRIMRGKIEAATAEQIDGGAVVTINIGNEPKNFTFQKEVLNDAFLIVYSFLDKERKLMRFVVSSFYFIGIALLLYVFINNFLTVIRYLGLLQ